jgi:hypothetical protein
MTTAPVIPDVITPQPRRYSAVDKRYALRAVVVPASLADLHGPAAGLIELPQRLFWSDTDHVFDLSDCDRLLEMYEAVFDAARTQADLADYLNGETLDRVWPRLALSPRVRRAWEAAHPELASITRASTIQASAGPASMTRAAAAA